MANSNNRSSKLSNSSNLSQLSPHGVPNAVIVATQKTDEAESMLEALSKLPQTEEITNYILKYEQQWDRNQPIISEFMDNDSENDNDNSNDNDHDAEMRGININNDVHKPSIVPQSVYPAVSGRGGRRRDIARGGGHQRIRGRGKSVSGTFQCVRERERGGQRAEGTIARERGHGRGRGPGHKGGGERDIRQISPYTAPLAKVGMMDWIKKGHPHNDGPYYQLPIKLMVHENDDTMVSKLYLNCGDNETFVVDIESEDQFIIIKVNLERRFENVYGDGIYNIQKEMRMYKEKKQKQKDKARREAQMIAEQERLEALEQRKLRERFGRLSHHKMRPKCGKPTRDGKETLICTLELKRYRVTINDSDPREMRYFCNKCNDRIDNVRWSCPQRIHDIDLCQVCYDYVKENEDEEDDEDDVKDDK